MKYTINLYKRVCVSHTNKHIYMKIYSICVCCYVYVYVLLASLLLAYQSYCAKSTETASRYRVREEGRETMGGWRVRKREEGKE